MYLWQPINVTSTNTFNSQHVNKSWLQYLNVTVTVCKWAVS